MIFRKSFDQIPNDPNFTSSLPLRQYTWNGFIHPLSVAMINRLCLTVSTSIVLLLKSDEIIHQCTNFKNDLYYLPDGQFSQSRIIYTGISVNIAL